MTLLEAISPTARDLLELQFYPVAYTWNDPHLGTLSGSTVITGADEDAALKHFRLQHPHLTSATIIKD